MFDVTASKTNTRALTNKKITNTQNKRTSTPKRKQTSASIQITNSKSKQLFTTLSRLAKKENRTESDTFHRDSCTTCVV